MNFFILLFFFLSYSFLSKRIAIFVPISTSDLMRKASYGPFKYLYTHKINHLNADRHP